MKKQPSEQLEKKVNQAIKLLQSASKATGGGEVIELSYSGGKDSDVILTLARMSGIPYEAIYKCTTIDPPGTIKHCKDNGVTIVRPKRSFLQIIEKKGLPHRFMRFCCSEIKEYKIKDNAIRGIRRSESVARRKNYAEDEPIRCRIYGSKKNHVNEILPILNWTNDDLVEFVEAYGVKCHPLYYDENGKFHVERRLGCIGCPLKRKNGVEDFIKYPKLLKAWLKYAQRWWDAPREKPIKSKTLFPDVYHLMYNHLFCKSREEYLKVADRDLKQELENYFNIKL